MAAKKKPADRWVVAWTGSRPWLVVMGRAVSHAPAAKTIRLADARCAVFFDQDTRGMLGLATRGPGASSRITDRCDEIELAYEGLATCSDAARAKWEAEPWR